MDTWSTSSHRLPAPRRGEGLLFLAEVLRDVRRVGAVAPSRPRLARALAEPVRELAAAGPVSVLEVGAGTGAVTRALLPCLGAGSHLDVVEAAPRFAAHLRALVRTHPAAARAGQVRVHETLVEHLDTGRRYDVVVSGLPFANLAPGQVDRLMGRFGELLHPGGVLTYFSYAGTRTARRLLGLREAAERQRAVEEVLAGHRARYAAGGELVWGNLPPARVTRLRAPVTVGRAR